MIVHAGSKTTRPLPPPREYGRDERDVDAKRRVAVQCRVEYSLCFTSTSTEI